MYVIEVLAAQTKRLDVVCLYSLKIAKEIKIDFRWNFIELLTLVKKKKEKKGPCQMSNDIKYTLNLERIGTAVCNNIFLF